MIRIHNKSFQARNYAVDRAVRILLPLFSSLLLWGIVCLICGRRFDITTALGNLLSLQGIFCPVSFETIWSLSYEVWFYIIVCAIGYAFANKGKWKVFVSLGTMTLCMVVFTKLEAYYLFIWLLGSFAYFITPYRSKMLCFSSAGITLIMLGVLQLTSETHTEVAGNMLTAIPRPVLEIVFGIVFCICLSQIIQFAPVSRFGKVLNNIGTKLAAFSYTLYLTHIPVRDLLWFLGAPKSTSITPLSITLFACWLLIAFIVAYGTYYVFERNTGIIKRAIKSNL